MATGYSMSALVDKVEAIESLPEPDFHLPLKDNLIITRGKGSPVQIDVSAAQDGSVMVPVPELFQADFSRASKKTCIQNGQLVEVGIDEPAFEDEGILIEGASTNNYSAYTSALGDPDDPVRDWEPYDKTPGQSDPFGTNTAILAKANGKEAVANIRGTANSVRPCFSIFVKQYEGATATIVNFLIRNNTIGSNYNFIGMDFSTKEPINTLCKVEPFSNGWFRLSGQSSGDFTVGDNYSLYMGTSGVPKVGEHNFYFFGVQVEDIPFASSYIPTEGAAVTRASDNLKIENNIHGYNYSISLISSIFVYGINSRQYYWYLKDSGTNRFCYRADDNGNIKSEQVVYESVEGITSLYIDNNYTEKNRLTVFSHEKVETYLEGIKVDDGIGCIFNHQDFPHVLLGYKIFGHIKDFKIWNHALTPNQIAVIGAKK